MHKLPRLPLIGIIAALATATTIVDASAPAQRPRAKRPAKTAAVKRAPTPPALPCGTVFDFQVRLDRAAFSPGEIDGELGDNLRHAIAAFQGTHNLEPSGNPECKTWAALGGDAAQPSVVPYQVQDADLAGPFEPDIPNDLMEESKLPALAYRSPLEEIAERFHVAPALLEKMNPGVQLAAGQTINVPAVQPFDPDAKAIAPPDAPDVVVQVTKEDSALRLLSPTGQLLYYAPVSSGSEHDPLPIGDWTVTVVQWHPEFHYNPDLFWDADPTNSKATIKPGPNGPVGVVWIGISVPHYGIHGTPEPQNVGHTQSHGCVRLTNWDAAHVASLVKKGAVVHFR